MCDHGKKTQFKQYEAYYFIDLFIEVFKETIQKDENIVISNFGTFKVKKRKKKQVMNLNTGQMTTIHPTRVIKFIPSKNFKIKWETVKKDL